MIVGITGTHHRRHPAVERWMMAFVARRGAPQFWVLGGARGVDTQARELCDVQGWSYMELFALWRWLSRYKAGKQRNLDMVDVVGSQPGGEFLAFPCPLSVGTWHCAGAAEDAGLRVWTCRQLVGAA